MNTAEPSQGATELMPLAKSAAAAARCQPVGSSSGTTGTRRRTQS
jgi:hypothetical protein